MALGRMLQRKISHLPALPWARTGWPRQRYVYFVQSGDDGPIKIGIAIDIGKRVEHLQVGNPYPLRVVGLFTGTSRDENDLHRRFAAHRLSGEWFAVNDELVELIRGLP